MRKYWSLMAIAIALQGLQAQDLRERNYYFETLNPGHEPKPQVEGIRHRAYRRASHPRTYSYTLTRRQRHTPQLATPQCRS